MFEYYYDHSDVTPIDSTNSNDFLSFIYDPFFTLMYDVTSLFWREKSE